MQRPWEPLIIHRHSAPLRAAPLCPQASLRLLTIKRPPPARARKDRSVVRGATAEAIAIKILRRNFIHQVLVPIALRCSNGPVHHSKRPSRRLPVCTLRNNLLLQSCNFRQLDQLHQVCSSIQPWRSNKKGKLSNSKNEKVERQRGLVTMVRQGSQTLNDRG
jgi:hypothetical protein